MKMRLSQRGRKGRRGWRKENVEGKGRKKEKGGIEEEIACYWGKEGRRKER